MRSWKAGAVVAVAAGMAWAQTLPAERADSRPGNREAFRAKAAPVAAKALDYLKSAQSVDGAWHGKVPGTDVAVTALVGKCFAQDPHYGPRHPIVRRALEYILKYQQPDGGNYEPSSLYANYTTSVVLMFLASLKDPELVRQVAGCQTYLKANQWIEGKRDAGGREISPTHAWYGGAGYGREKRPDLSNTQMMLEALHESGLPPTDPAFQKALKFIARCQMDERFNDQPFARGAGDGGFIYSPASSGESKAGKDGTAGRDQLRSYGSMTYSAFKSMLYADLKRSDPRVLAAWDWIRRNYTLESNPNMPGRQSKEGLYYFYHVFARALRAWGEVVVVDEKGGSHDWRNDLCAQLVKVQNTDGSWVNDADRWQEGNPYLVTAYCVLALQSAME